MNEKLMHVGLILDLLNVIFPMYPDRQLTSDIFQANNNNKPTNKLVFKIPIYYLDHIN